MGKRRTGCGGAERGIARVTDLEEEVSSEGEETLPERPRISKGWGECGHADDRRPGQDSF